MSNETENSRVAKKSRGGSRENNFTVVRLLATVFVFAGHMRMIMGGEAPYFCGFGLHELGVSVLFLISGYLITKSWLSDPDPLCYGIRRFFRLWPPFAVMILIMVFIAGPLVSDLGVQGYFGSWFQTYLLNLRFYIVYAQPGVFSDLPLAFNSNGSLWTMPVEAALYVLTPLLLTVFRVRSKQEASFYPMAVFAVIVCGFELCIRIFWPDVMVVFYGTNLVAAYHLVVFYVIGMLFTYDRVRRYLNIQAGCVAMILLLVFQASSEPLRYLLLYLCFPYFIFSLVFAPKPAFCRMGRRLEPSYGIYLYGFFFQQLAVSLQQHSGVSLGYTVTLLLSALPAVAAAALSYYLVEQPALGLGRFLIRKIKGQG